MMYRFICLLFLTTLSVQAQSEFQLMPAAKAHPRLLFLAGEEAHVAQTIEKDSIWWLVHARVMHEADNILQLPLLKRIQIGRRLLDKSREMLRRQFMLAYAYRMTKHKKYLNRAEAELVNVAQFSDWNPAHFLDVAEMTMAMAIGYDWLYADLNTYTKRVVREAILTKGLTPSFDPKYNGWLTASHNWNQVCNAGMVFGALAIMDEQPAVSARIISRAIESIKLPMADFAPDGAYPEGYAYWGYGTTFQVLFNDVIEKALGSDFGLNTTKGFYQSANYLLHMVGPSGLNFNYSDATNGLAFHPAMAWFAKKMDDPSILYKEIETITHWADSDNNRYLPMALVWGAKIPLEGVKEPNSLYYVGGGKNPVAMMQTKWKGNDALYLAVKGGSPSVNHGHMDVGSFVFDAHGLRWAMDFGMQEYESLESQGVKLWDMTQNSQRWDIFRYNNLAHNTLTINQGYQQVVGWSDIKLTHDRPDHMEVALNMSSLYANQVKIVTRKLALVDQKQVEISDEIQTSNQDVNLQWTMVTPADFEVGKDGMAYLSQQGKKVQLILEGLSGTWETWSTEPGHSYDAKNPGTRFVGFKVSLAANKTHAWKVIIKPL